MRKLHLFAAVAFIVALVAAFGIWRLNQAAFSDPGAKETDGSKIGPYATGVFTRSEVATHKDKTSCWTIIDGTIYDLTSWIPQHPGGERAILGLCGVDGSAPFHGQHGDASEQMAILATLKVGTLTQ